MSKWYENKPADDQDNRRQVDPAMSLDAVGEAIIRGDMEGVDLLLYGWQSNGFAEGMILKIKMIHRRAYGYHNFEPFRLHILDAPDPVSCYIQNSYFYTTSLYVCGQSILY